MPRRQDIDIRTKGFSINNQQEFTTEVGKFEVVDGALYAPRTLEAVVSQQGSGKVLRREFEKSFSPEPGEVVTIILPKGKRIIISLRE